MGKFDVPRVRDWGAGGLYGLTRAQLLELERLANRLGELDDRQRAAVEALAVGIVGKLLHEPTVRMKDAAGTARGERLAEAMRDLFDL